MASLTPENLVQSSSVVRSFRQRALRLKEQFPNLSDADCQEIVLKDFNNYLTNTAYRLEPAREDASVGEDVERKEARNDTTSETQVPPVRQLTGILPPQEPPQTTEHTPNTVQSCRHPPLVPMSGSEHRPQESSQSAEGSFKPPPPSRHPPLIPMGVSNPGPQKSPQSAEVPSNPTQPSRQTPLAAIDIGEPQTRRAIEFLASLRNLRQPSQAPAAAPVLVNPQSQNPQQTPQPVAHRNTYDPRRSVPKDRSNDTPEQMALYRQRKVQRKAAKERKKLREREARRQANSQG